VTSVPTAGEPVPPLSAGLAGDADNQIGGRRRRRRGSRRRSDRLGIGPDGQPYPEEGGLPEASGIVEITPTSSDVEVALASSGTIEVPPEEAPPAEPVVEASEVPAAPRNRRRSTRRPTATAEAVASPEPVPAAEDVSTPPAPEPEPARDVVASDTDAGSTNGAAPADETTATPRARPRRVASAARGRSRRA
jgi:ribonuclease E